VTTGNIKVHVEASKHENGCTCTSTNPSSTQNQDKREIFIDRDSNRFSFVLDYMRNNGIVELPLNISRNIFLNELEYYGFDVQTIAPDCTTCTIPTCEAIKCIHDVHQKFFDRLRVQDYSILAYACFCEYLYKRSLDLVMNLSSTSTLSVVPLGNT
jgi:BTB/POZ domain